MPWIAIRSPATAGPTSLVAFIDAVERAMAAIRFCGPTTCAISGVRAGMPKAKNVPWINPTMNSSSTVMVLVRTRNAVTRASTPVSDCWTSCRLRLLTRSATAPPISEKNSIGRANESETRPVSAYDSVSCHASAARATCCMFMPMKPPAEARKR